ncbi:MAG: redoxin domain-containing protein [Planctomycetes bacterium]|nr:redoxin domain-containing protein [Planctomycetota bacterium]
MIPHHARAVPALVRVLFPAVALGLALVLLHADPPAAPLPPPAVPGAPAAAALPAAVDIGAAVGRLRFVDRWYVQRTMDDFGRPKAWVLLFVADGCPVAGRYLPRLVDLEKAYRAKGAQFLAVDETRGGTIVDMAASAVDHKLEFPILKDVDGSVALAVGARRTPEIVVLDAARRLRYRGRVDSQFRVGGENAAPGREDLREALDEVLAGREASVPEAEVAGCLITFPRPVPAGGAGAAGGADREPTYAEDVAPILKANCQSCHRVGGDAPFPLATLDDARKHAAMLAEVVELGRMPPWYGDPRHGTFANDRHLSDATRRTLVAWARGAQSAGELSRAPEPLEPAKGKWKISKPDLVLQIPKEIKVPATGYFAYQYAALHQVALMPHIFAEDTWVQEIQILPRNRRVLHHANLFYANVKDPKQEHHFVTGEVPGGDPMRLSPGTAFLFPKGSVLGLQMHYVPCGEEESDVISVGLVFAKAPVERRLRHHEVKNLRFEIPAGAPAHEVVGKRKLAKDSTGTGMYVHMHTRGRDMRISALYPDGRKETLLLVPNYSFDWQQAYLWGPGKRFPAGTELECVAHFDNSPLNPFNPNPAIPVRFGLETTAEMMYGFFFFTEDGERLGLEVEPATGWAVKKPGEAARPTQPVEAEDPQDVGHDQPEPADAAPGGGK